MPRRYGVLNTGYSQVNAQQLTRRFGIWVYLCVNMNANVGASIPLRLFSIGDKTMVEKCERLRPRKLDSRTKAFFAGRAPVQPSPVVMKMIQGYGDNLTEITNHPILDLFQDVNPQTEGWCFRQQMLVDQQVYGDHWWQIIVGADGKPRQLWRMRTEILKLFPSPSPIPVDIFPGAEECIEKVEYGIGAEKQTLMPGDWVRFQIPHPSDPWSAYGTLAAWLKTVDAAHAMVNFQEDVFARGGSPDWLLTSKTATSPDQRKAFERSWREKFGRLANRLTNLMFTTGDITPTKLSQTQRELDFVQSEDHKRDQICAAFGVPRAFVDSDRVAANSEQAMNQYKMLTIWPMLTRIEQVWNQRFIPRWSDRLILVHDNPIAEDETIRIQRRESKLRSGWSVDEIRIEDGDEPLNTPMSTEPLVLNTIKPLNSLTAEPPPNPLDIAAAQAANRPPMIAAPAAPSKNVKSDCGCESKGERLPGESLQDCVSRKIRIIMHENPHMDAHQAAAIAFSMCKKKKSPIGDSVVEKCWAIHKAHDAQEGLPDDGSVRGFRRNVDRVLSEQTEAVISGIQTMTSASAALQHALEILRRPEWEAKLDRAIRPFIETSIRTGGDYAAQRLLDFAQQNVDTQLPEAFGFNVTNPEVQKYVDEATVKLRTGINETTEINMRDLLGDGMAKGETVPELADRVRGWARGTLEGGGPQTAARAEMIARTESARAYVRGQEEAWVQSGVVTGKKWLLAPDACEFCRAAASAFESKQLGQAFFSKGHVLEGTNGGKMTLDYDDVMGPPLHPSCRCDLVPEIANA